MTKNDKQQPPNEIIFYETEDGKISIAVRFEHENIWLTQKHMADLFDRDERVAEISADLDSLKSLMRERIAS